MKILDAGTEVLDDFDVLKFIREKRIQIETEDQEAKKQKRHVSQRPPNFLKALEKHEQHLNDKDRPFLNNPKYDNDSKYLTRLMQTLSPRVQLTKSEYLVLVNQRPYRRAHLAAMIEDIETRFSHDDQNFIRDTVVEVLGLPEDKEQNADAQPVELKG